jgi:lipopolysaccharide export system ATP-binding protein
MPLTIYTRDLVKKYGNRVVVNHVSFDVKQGEIVGLLGPNGAGKTTSFYQVVGLVKPDQGEVFLGDENITKLPMYKRAKKGIGYLPQEASVFRKLSVEDNIKAVLEMTKLSKEEQREKMETLLDEFRLHHVRKSNGDVLSGGERRRTEIARALAVDPKFILLDEPFAGIDPIAVEDIQAIVAKLKHKNIGILITDHNVTETLSICDRAYLLIEGKIFKHGTAEELASDEQVKKLYLGRNFELRRKDYLYEEQGLTVNTKAQQEIKPEMLAYSLESALAMVDKVVRYTPAGTTISDPSSNGLSDLSAFLPELKKSLLSYGAAHGSEKFNEIARSISLLKPNNYYYSNDSDAVDAVLGDNPDTPFSGSTINVSKLQEDLRDLKTALDRLLLLVKNHAFEEAM